ncbi:hypothetical protein LZ554_008901 [Drepanopeziza brunnea f. sp. 'monogermtubi']|nr:hypothetical protein LZ554_008901 [Drepanopeziza brunnea f. sp. 'monogermtubi']
MPILKFYTSAGQLTPTEKQELAQKLTERYAVVMPAFFVSVIFHETQDTGHGTQDSIIDIRLPYPNKAARRLLLPSRCTDGQFVRFTAEHIAVNFNNDLESANRYLDFVGRLFKERFGPKGWT